MARGDLVFFNEGMNHATEYDFASADVIKVAICDNTVAPSKDMATPELGDFTQVGTAGSYVSGGVSIGTWGSLITRTSNVLTLDSATNPNWTQNASNDTDAYWAIIYNSDDPNLRALAYVDLGGPVDMSAGPLSLTWSTSGIARITNNS